MASLKGKPHGVKEGLSPSPIFSSHLKEYSLPPPLCLGLAEACNTGSSHLTVPATPGPHMQDTQGNKILEGSMVREAPVAAGRRLWLIICSHWMGMETKPFFFLSQLFSSSSSEIAITSLELLLQLLLVASGVGEKMGQGGLCLAIRLISQAAGRRRWP